MSLAVLALLVPSIGLGDQLPAPLEKKINPGISSVSYMGQTIRFVTPAALLVKCDPEDTTHFRMSVSLYPGTPVPNSVGSNAENLNIYWTNYSTEVYNGGVPMGEPWTGSFNTEGGFVDR